MTARRLEHGVSDGWAWRRWNGEIVEDTDPVAYGDAWHYLVGKVVIATASLELELAFLAAAGLDGSLDAYRKYLGVGLRKEAKTAAKRLTDLPGAREAVQMAIDALTRRDHVIHWPPVAVVVPDGESPPARGPVSGHWRLPTRPQDAVPVGAATTGELREILAALESAWSPVADIRGAQTSDRDRPPVDRTP